MASLARERVNLPRSTDQDQRVAWSDEDIIKHRIFAREKGLSPGELMKMNQWDELNVKLTKQSVDKILKKVANKSRHGRYILDPGLFATLDIDAYPYKASCRNRIKERVTLLPDNSSKNKSPEAKETASGDKKRGLDRAPLPPPKRQQRTQVIDLTSDTVSESDQLVLPAVPTPPPTPEEYKSQVPHTGTAVVNVSDKAQTTAGQPQNENLIQNEQVGVAIEEPKHPDKDIQSSQHERNDDPPAIRESSGEDKENITELQEIIKTRERQIINQRDRIERWVVDIEGMATVHDQHDLSLHDINSYRYQLEEAQEEARSREEHIQALRADLKKAKDATAREVGRRVEAEYEADEWKADAIAWEARAENLEERTKRSKAKITNLEAEVDKWTTKAGNWEAAFESLAERVVVGSSKASERLALLHRDSR